MLGSLRHKFESWHSCQSCVMSCSVPVIELLRRRRKPGKWLDTAYVLATACCCRRRTNLQCWRTGPRTDSISCTGPPCRQKQTAVAHGAGRADTRTSACWRQPPAAFGGPSCRAGAWTLHRGTLTHKLTLPLTRPCRGTGRAGRADSGAPACRRQPAPAAGGPGCLAGARARARALPRRQRRRGRLLGGASAGARHADTPAA